MKVKDFRDWFTHVLLWVVVGVVLYGLCSCAFTAKMLHVKTSHSEMSADTLSSVIGKVR